MLEFAVEEGIAGFIVFQFVESFLPPAGQLFFVAVIEPKYARRRVDDMEMYVDKGRQLMQYFHVIGSNNGKAKQVNNRHPAGERRFVMGGIV